MLISWLEYPRSPLEIQKESFTSGFCAAPLDKAASRRPGQDTYFGRQRCRTPQFITTANGGNHSRDFVRSNGHIFIAAHAAERVGRDGGATRSSELRDTRLRDRGTQSFLNAFPVIMLLPLSFHTFVAVNHPAKNGASNIRPASL